MQPRRNEDAIYRNSDNYNSTSASLYYSLFVCTTNRLAHHTSLKFLVTDGEEHFVKCMKIVMKLQWGNS